MQLPVILLLLAPLASASALAAEQSPNLMAGQLTNLALGLDTRAAPEPESEAAPLDKRDCDYNGCKCSKRGDRTPQGQFCGGCHWYGSDSYVVTRKRVNSHVYECSPKGKCCDYGYAKDCAKEDGTGRCG